MPDCPDGISVPTSHELVETVIDWPATLWTPAPDGGPDIAYEGCDPCEDQSYEIGGVRVSNFVLPTYFTPGSPGPWDHLGLLPGPLTLSDGGYWARREGEPTWGPRRGSRVLLPWRRGWRRMHVAPGLSRS